MRRYEIMIILSGKLTEDNLRSLNSKCQKLILGKEGKLVKKEEWGKKNFAYEIKKEKSGYYFIYYVETTSENILELNRIYRITPEIIRIMVIKHEDKWPYEMNKNVINKIPHRYSKKNNKRRNFAIKGNISEDLINDGVDRKEDK